MPAHAFFGGAAGRPAPRTNATASETLSDEGHSEAIDLQHLSSLLSEFLSSNSSPGAAEATPAAGAPRATVVGLGRFAAAAAAAATAAGSRTPQPPQRAPAADEPAGDLPSSESLEARAAAGAAAASASAALVADLASTVAALARRAAAADTEGAAAAGELQALRRESGVARLGLDEARAGLKAATNQISRMLLLGRNTQVRGALLDSSTHPSLSGVFACS
jgi:hypothetical protein